MKRIFLSLVLFSVLLSCSKNEAADSETTQTEEKKTDEPCREVIVTTPASLETEYGCTNTRYHMHIALNDTYRVIQSQSEFNSLVTGTCMPNIDFNRFALIIGKKRLINGNRSISYSLSRDCNSNTMTLNVGILNDFSMMAPNITYHALVPKLNANEQVVVNVTVQ